MAIPNAVDDTNGHGNQVLQDATKLGANDVGVGEGGEFYRPLAIAIIGGTITSTFLTLLVVPTFYDSIEIARDRMFAKYGRRAERWNPFFAFTATLIEAILTLLFIRLIYRLLMQLVFMIIGKKA